MAELVVLVDEKNNEIGTAPKNTVHSGHTPLHRGFSLFLFNKNHELLLTRRADTKKTFPGVWTNTVCGHPAPGEDIVDAVKRRLRDELGITSEDIKIIAPYRYRFTDIHGIVENEICPILVGHTFDVPKASPTEVNSWKLMQWKEFLSEIKLHPEIYSPWCIEEAAILQQKGPELR
jgi:isopentenyl-diphosphate delta-isomerase